MNHYAEHTDRYGNLWLIQAQYMPDFGTYAPTRWRRVGPDWILSGYSTSGGITDPQECIEQERQHIDLDIMPREKAAI